MLKNFAGGFSFAHLTGLGARPSAKGKDLREKDDEAAAVAAAAAAEDEEEMEEEDAEAEGEDENASGNGGKKSAKKAKKKDGEDEGEEDENSEGEDDGDDEDEDEEAESSDGKKGAKKAAAKPAVKADTGAFKRGRKAERRRVGLILSHPAAASNIALATRLACNTGMSSSAAIALLEHTPAAGRGRLDSRMSDSRVPDVKAGGGDQQLTGAKAIDASWDTAMGEFAPKK